MLGIATAQAPLYLHDRAVHALIQGCLIAWAVAEIYFRRRNREDHSQLEWSFVVLFAAITAGFILGPRLEHVDAGVLDGDWLSVVLGLALLVVGIALRFWAIITLGRFFKFTVSIQPEHRVIRTGPYRHIRHPSYLGLLIACLGLGLALDSWLSIVALVALPLAGLLVRIPLEETTLKRALGDEYDRYASQTARLVPGIW